MAHNPRRPALTDTSPRGSPYPEPPNLPSPALPDQRRPTAYRHTRYDGHGNQNKALDALGRASYFGYDAFDRQVSATDALSASRYFTYDDADNLTSATNELGATCLLRLRRLPKPHGVDRRPAGKKPPTSPTTSGGSRRARRTLSAARAILATMPWACP